MKLFIMLQNKGYQDPTYKLFYYAEKDALVGFYYHAAMDKTFEVIFLLLPLLFRKPAGPKGSAKNNLVEFAPEFAVALIDLIEQNRRNSELFRGLLRLKIG